eukprot:2182050-Pyramimonas_sp.AAC.1
MHQPGVPAVAAPSPAPAPAVAAPSPAPSPAVAVPPPAPAPAVVAPPPAPAPAVVAPPSPCFTSAWGAWARSLSQGQLPAVVIRELQDRQKQQQQQQSCEPQPMGPEQRPLAPAGADSGKPAAGSEATSLDSDMASAPPPSSDATRTLALGLHDDSCPAPSLDQDQSGQTISDELEAKRSIAAVDPEGSTLLD